MRLLQKIGLAVATLVLLAGTAAAQRFSVEVRSRPRVYRTYSYPAPRYYYTYPQSYYTYTPGYYTSPGYYYSSPSYYTTYRPGVTYSYTIGHRRHHRWHR